MTTGNFSPAEWKQLVNAPEVIYGLLTATDRSTIFIKRREAKALKKFMSGYKSQSDLVQSIIAGQEDADDEIEATPEEAQKMLNRVGALIEDNTDDAEGDAVRDFLMSAGEAIAEAVREQVKGGKSVSDKEQETLAVIASALRATDADKGRRRGAAVAAQARKQAEKKELEAKREAEAQKKEDEARKKREAEARQEAREKREAEAQKKAEETRKQREAKARIEARQKEAEEAQKKREAAAQKEREAEARKEAREKREAEALKKAEEERALREAEAAKVAAAKAAAEAAAKEAETIYVVKPGDTLSGIAKSVYGKAGRWPEIFEANKDVIENPNLIRPGWKLRIPK